MDEVPGRIPEPSAPDGKDAGKVPPPPAPDAPQPGSLPAAAAKSKKKQWAASLPAHAQFVLLVMVIALFIITFIVQAFRIPSGSMEDTLLVGDYLLVDKAHFAPGGHWAQLLPYRAIHRGDIVVFRYPVDPAQHFVKRIIGMPGDRVHLWHSRVYVNGQPLAEPYVVYKEHAPDEFRDDFPGGSWDNENVDRPWAELARHLLHNGDLRVPPGEYFVLGDNRDQSLDSRYWGFVPRESIIGRPLLIYFSLVDKDAEKDDEKAAENDATAGDDDDKVETRAADDKLVTLGARISHLFEDMRWRRILRLAP